MHSYQQARDSQGRVDTGLVMRVHGNSIDNALVGDQDIFVEDTDEA